MTETAKVYGELLYELALEEKLTDDILAELDCAAELFRENPQYSKLMLLPSVPKSERCAALDETFGGKVNQYLVNFMKLLVEKREILFFFLQLRLEEKYGFFIHLITQGICIDHRFRSFGPSLTGGRAESEEPFKSFYPSQDTNKSKDGFYIHNTEL